MRHLLPLILLNFRLDSADSAQDHFKFRPLKLKYLERRLRPRKLQSGCSMVLFEENFKIDYFNSAQIVFCLWIG